MLTLTLRALERDGLLTRTVTPSIPPRVDYELTKLGRSLLEPVSELGTWARKNRAAIVAARERFDGGAKQGASVASRPFRRAARTAGRGQIARLRTGVIPPIVGEECPGRGIERGERAIIIGQDTFHSIG